MDRLSGAGYRTSISAALEIIPAALHDLVRVDWFCGADPLFADLHRIEDASYGRSYRSTAHCVYAHHQEHRARASRRTTIALPTVETPDVIVHELGHVLHERLRWEPVARPVTWYAGTDLFEAFAEAFTSWLIPGYARRADDRTIALLESLAAR